MGVLEAGLKMPMTAAQEANRAAAQAVKTLGLQAAGAADAVGLVFPLD